MDNLRSLFSLSISEFLDRIRNGPYARILLLEMLSDTHPELADALNVWKPQNNDKKEEAYYQDWINTDILLYTTIGAGFVAVHNDKEIMDDDASEEVREKATEVFASGAKYGFDKAMDNLSLRYQKLGR